MSTKKRSADDEIASGKHKKPKEEVIGLPNQQQQQDQYADAYNAYYQYYNQYYGQAAGYDYSQYAMQSQQYDDQYAHQYYDQTQQDPYAAFYAQQSTDATQAGGDDDSCTVRGDSTMKPKKPKAENTAVDLKHADPRTLRAAAGEVWQDYTLTEWDPNDFRLFVGDLGPEVSDEGLAKAFSKYKTFQKARVIRYKQTGKSKGYGFVSFKDPDDFTKAFREMNGKYIGNRPCKLQKSNWKERNVTMTKAKKITKQGYLNFLQSELQQKKPDK